MTGATGTLGRVVLSHIRDRLAPSEVRALSRDEMKQQEIRAQFPGVRFLLGDVRDGARVTAAANGVDVVVHAAALKHIDAGEREPAEFTKTNIVGCLNVIDAAIAGGAEKVCFISSDKACNPTLLYGATKMVGERLFMSANGQGRTSFVVVRPGNLIGSRGSVLPVFLERVCRGQRLGITHPEMVRFWLTPERTCELVESSLRDGRPGEVFAPKCDAYRIMDLARVLDPSRDPEIIGLRPGEKIHEDIVTLDEAPRTREMDGAFIVEPAAADWAPPASPGRGIAGAYGSQNARVMSPDEIAAEIDRMCAQRPDAAEALLAVEILADILRGQSNGEDGLRDRLERLRSGCQRRRLGVRDALFTRDRTA